MPAPAFSRDCAVAPSIRRRQRALAHAQPFPSSRHDYHSSTEARIRQVRPPTGSIAHTDRQQRSDDRPGRARVRDGWVAPSGRRDGPVLPRCANNRCGAAGRPALDLCNRCGATIRRTAARPPHRPPSPMRATGTPRVGLSHAGHENFARRPACGPASPPPSRSDPRCAGPLFRAAARYIRSIIALPNPEQLTCVEPGIRRAKS
jgi:hypothetical protein